MSPKSVTSKFGTSERVNHDSSRFYKSRMYAGACQRGGPAVEAPVPTHMLDKLFCKSSERMEGLPDNSVHLMVTSPPYNDGKDYDEDLTLQEYLDIMIKVLGETHRVLAPGGRVCINIANLGRKPYIPMHSHYIRIMEQLGFLMRGEIIWNKSTSANYGTAWGSWLSAANPTLRDGHEYILVYSKDNYSRPRGKSTITRDEFLAYTKSVWTMRTESARRVGHPAPFPVELPARCIKLYTYEGDVVLDPFIGAGATAVAAKMLGRHYVGYDIKPEYIEKAESRVGGLR